MTEMQQRTDLPTLSPHAGGQPEDAPLEKFPLEERILVVLTHQPWASASDLARRLDLSNSDIHKVCHDLEQNRMIIGRDLGVTRREQRRYVLTLEGVRHVTSPFRYRDLVRAALPLTWQMTEEGVTRMISWLPMIEALYELLPTFWTSGLADPFQWASYLADPAFSNYVWLGRPSLTRLLWLPSGRLHAVASWCFKGNGRHPRQYSIPFLWAGLLQQEDYRSRSLRLGSRFISCPRNPGNPISWDIEPPVVAIGVDQFAAFRSKSAYGNDVKVGAVDTNGALVWTAEASHREWTPSEGAPRAKSIGRPEAATAVDGPDLVHLGGTREYRLISFLSDFRGATRSDLMRAPAPFRRVDRRCINAPGRAGPSYQRGEELVPHQKGPGDVGFPG